MNKRIAIITGDIVGSTELVNSQRKKLPGLLENCFYAIKESEPRATIEKQFEIFRGDSFQGLINDVNRSLIIGLKIISYLQMQPVTKKKSHKTINARVAIGIGDIGLQMKNLKESDGEALRISGRLLDTMKYENQLISISSGDEQLKIQFELITLLLNVIIWRWTNYQAEVIYYLLNEKKQIEIADIIQVSQPSINQRIYLGNWKEIDKTLKIFNSIIQ